MGRKQGLSEEKLKALPDFENAPVFSEEERSVLRYADAMAHTPVDVSDPVFEAVRRLYGDRQIVELTSALAWEHYRARFDHALHIEAEGFSRDAYCPLPLENSK